MDEVAEVIELRSEGSAGWWEGLSVGVELREQAAWLWLQEKGDLEKRQATFWFFVGMKMMQRHGARCKDQEFIKLALMGLATQAPSMYDNGGGRD